MNAKEAYEQSMIKRAEILNASIFDAIADGDIQIEWKYQLTELQKEELKSKGFKVNEGHDSFGFSHHIISWDQKNG